MKIDLIIYFLKSRITGLEDFEVEVFCSLSTIGASTVSFGIINITLALSV